MIVLNVDDILLKNLINDILIDLLPGLIAEQTGKSWLNTTEASDYLSCTSRQLHNYRKNGWLKYSKDGRMIWYHKSDLDQFLKDRSIDVAHV